jgi:hypothetical protein
MSPGAGGQGIKSDIDGNEVFYGVGGFGGGASEKGSQSAGSGGSGGGGQGANGTVGKDGIVIARLPFDIRHLAGKEE